MYEAPEVTELGTVEAFTTRRERGPAFDRRQGRRRRRRPTS